MRTDKIPYRDEDGEIVGVIVFAVDISERVSAEEALQRAHEELERRVDERTQQLAAHGRDAACWKWSSASEPRN